MIKRKLEIKDITPGELAKEFCEMDSDQQAEFFNKISDIMSGWDRSFVFQLQGVTESETLDIGGRMVMDLIGSYSKKYDVQE